MYKGSLRSKKHDELALLAAALLLPTDGTNVQLASRIKTHLSGNSKLQDNHRVAGLFAPAANGLVNVLVAPAPAPAPLPTTTSIETASETDLASLCPQGVCQIVLIYLTN
jgi:hypothetical protein